MASAAQAFVRRARAKLNLRLEVGGKGADGLHVLRTVMAELRLSDTLEFSPSLQGFAVTCDDPRISEMSNLARRAVEALGVDPPSTHVHVKKSIPLEAGLGGGSADAAAALLGVVHLLRGQGVTIGDEQVRQAAIRTGSDVPACTIAGLKLVEGSGDVVRPVAANPPTWGVLLLKPAVGVPTADAYRVLDESRAGRTDISLPTGADSEALCRAYAASDLGTARTLLRNDLQAPVESAFPPIADARRRLLRTGAAAVMLCGSGSTVAALFRSQAEAEHAERLLTRIAGDWTCATGFSDGG
jgi:4-diphosphocytidyl-2-C-methyl-D-erythritol kinase